MLTRKRARSAHGGPESDAGDRSNALTPYDVSVIAGVSSPPAFPRPSCDPLILLPLVPGPQLLLLRLHSSCRLPLFISMADLAHYSNTAQDHRKG